MPETKSHKTTSNRLAKKFKTKYNSGQGPDIQTNNKVIEVETLGTVKDGLRQLQGFKKKVYIAGVNKETVNKAIELTKNTTIGVMDKDGNIIKRSTRKTK